MRGPAPTRTAGDRGCANRRGWWKLSPRTANRSSAACRPNRRRAATRRFQAMHARGYEPRGPLCLRVEDGKDAESAISSSSVRRSIHQSRLNEIRERVQSLTRETIKKVLPKMICARNRSGIIGRITGDSNPHFGNAPPQNAFANLK